MPSNKRRRSSLDKFLEQKKTPVFTAMSVVRTVIVWMIVVMDLLYTARDWGGLAQLFLLMSVLTVGSIINSAFGGTASFGGEYCGSRIAALGRVASLLRKSR